MTNAFRLSNTASDATIKFNIGLNEYTFYSHAFNNNTRAFSRESFVNGLVNSAHVHTDGLEGTNRRSGFESRYTFGFSRNNSSSVTRLPITGGFSDLPSYESRKVLTVSVNNVQADLYGNINLVPDLQEITDLASDKTITDLKSNNKNVIVTFSNIPSRQTIKLPNPATHKGKTLTVINNTEYAEPNSDIDLEQSSTIKFELTRLTANTFISNGTTWIMIGRNNVSNPTHPELEGEG